MGYSSFPAVDKIHIIRSASRIWIIESAICYIVNASAHTIAARVRPFVKDYVITSRQIPRMVRGVKRGRTILIGVISYGGTSRTAGRCTITVIPLATICVTACAVVMSARAGGCAGVGLITAQGVTIYRFGFKGVTAVRAVLS